MPVRPIRTLALVRRDEAESQHGAIIIPKASRETPKLGTVVAVGDQVDLEHLVPGDRVMFPSWGGTDLTIDGVQHLIIDQADVMAVLA